MRIVKAYLDVERLRLGDKLRLEIEVAPEAQGVLIPILSIQPLVENAVKHGIAPQAGGGLIQIHGRIDSQGSLLISVRDSGPGFSEATRRGSRKRRTAIGVVLRRRGQADDRYRRVGRGSIGANPSGGG